MKEKPCFNQIAALILTLFCGSCLMICFFSEKKGETQTMIIGAFCAGLSAGIIYLMKASGDQNHKESMSRMTDALKDSSPSPKESSASQVVQ